jgi:hypothetical protein
LALVAGKGLETMRLPTRCARCPARRSIEIVEVANRGSAVTRHHRPGGSALRRALVDCRGRVVLAMDALQVIRYRTAQGR